MPLKENKNLFKTILNTTIFLSVLHILQQSFTRFQRHHCMQYASALSYSTLLAIVPITVLLFYISLQTVSFSDSFHQVREQFFQQLLPSSRLHLQDYLNQTTQNIQSFSYLGLSILFLSALWLSTGIERAINHIYQVKQQHRLHYRIPSHIILWLLAPMLMMLSISISTWFTALPYIHGVGDHIPFLSRLLPWCISSFALFLLYYFVPNSKVHYHDAAIAAMFAALLFEGSKWAFSFYITQVAMYEKLYGALASLPIFMLWVWLSWVIVLWGAECCVSLKHQRRQG
ncbi:MAG: YhjD/YihY/BrkB family envelope integrity protein [Mariprofundaceae bacterium]|nr:YhjD/YihY/BrkB family envelope integrity protein [Mariprofundaceae bacterium]